MTYTVLPVYTGRLTQNYTRNIVQNLQILMELWGHRTKCRAQPNFSNKLAQENGPLIYKLLTTPLVQFIEYNLKKKLKTGRLYSAFSRELGS